MDPNNIVICRYTSVCMHKTLVHKDQNNLFENEELKSIINTPQTLKLDKIIILKLWTLNLNKIECAELLTVLSSAQFRH